ncbi:MAG: PrgI family protein [Atopobiaceae bacterium]|jgi:hypothetical protein|nr:PrgI family protein [Atopobiaceae bacterium]
MSLSVAVHKDIGEYTEKVVGKLSLRTLGCVAGGLATSVGTAAACHVLLGVEPADASLPVMAASMPFWLMGFWRPHGMRAERFVPLLWEHATGDGLLLYRSSCSMAAPPQGLAARESRGYRRKSRRKGAELHEPSQEGQDDGRGGRPGAHAAAGRQAHGQEDAGAGARAKHLRR